MTASCARPHGIGHGDQPAHRLAVPDEDGGLPRVAQPVRLGHDVGWHGHAELGEEHVIADEHLIAVDLGGDTHARERAERDGLSQRQLPLLRPVHDRHRHVVLGEPLGTRRQPQHPLLAPAVAKSDDVGQCRPAVGEGAGLVEGDRPRLPDVLQGGASFEEDAVAGRVGQTGEGRGRGGDHQRAGRGDDQQGDGAVDRGLPVLTENERRNHPHQRRERDHADRVPPFEAVGETLGGALLRLRLLDELDDPGQRALLVQTVDPHLDGAVSC